MAKGKRPRKTIDVRFSPDASEKAQTKRMWPQGTPMEKVTKGK